MATYHVVLTKEFTFRGKPERFSNGYNMQSAQDFSEADLATLSGQLIYMEKRFHPTWVKFVYANAGKLGQDSDYVEEFDNPQLGLVQAAPCSPGQHPETCTLVQSKIGPRRYLMKYYHNFPATGPHSDVLDGGMQELVDGLVAELTDGSLHGQATLCRPNGALATAPMKCDPYARVHQLKRRGKRP